MRTTADGPLAPQDALKLLKEGDDTMILTYVLMIQCDLVLDAAWHPFWIEKTLPCSVLLA